MPQNDFKLFAAGAGANTLTPAAFAAQNYLQQGFQNGVAQPYDINTVLRQLSTVTTSLAKFTADNQAADVLDDGNVANFVAKFTAALKGALSSSSIHIAVATGTGDAMVANATPALLASSPGVYAPAVLFLKTPSAANATTAPTINVNSIGNIVVTKRNSATTGGGDIPASSWIILLFDGAGGCFLSGGLAPSDVSSASSLGGKLVGCTDATQPSAPNTVLLTGSPSIGGYSLGQTFVWVPTTTTTGVATINVDGKGQLSLKRPDGSATQANDVVAGRLTQATYDSNGNARLHGIPTTSTSARADSCFAHGEARLNYVSSNTISLSPFNGNNLIVNGAQIQIPAVGLSGGVAGQYVNGSASANQSLAASTAYYVSVAVIGGTPVLRYWNAAAYGHLADATAGNVGVEVIANGTAPISTDTFVGLVFTSPSFTFQDAEGARYVLSWFNPRPANSVVVFETAGSYSWTATSTTADVAVIGGGGSGGGSSNVYSGAAGGGGGRSDKRFTNLVVGQTYTVIVGAGGASVAAAGTSNGSTGGTSSFNGISATGGGGGVANNGAAVSGGLGGAGSGGDRNYVGQAGQSSTGASGYSNYPVGGGAVGFTGGGNARGLSGSEVATTPGSGGGGGFSVAPSGAGHDGAVYIRAL